jgi:hypothetical protein
VLKFIWCKDFVTWRISTLTELSATLAELYARASHLFLYSVVDPDPAAPEEQPRMVTESRQSLTDNYAQGNWESISPTKSIMNASKSLQIALLQ